jgi:hypothetical protein
MLVPSVFIASQENSSYIFSRQKGRLRWHQRVTLEYNARWQYEKPKHAQFGHHIGDRRILPDKVTKRWIEDHLDTLHPAHVEALVYLLAELRQLFDGDLEAMLILATTSTVTTGGDWRAALLHDQKLEAITKPTNTLSIAQTTRIPRETVRRKLKWLESKGWVERDGSGNWNPTSRTRQELRSGTDASITYLKAILNAAQNA